jgi:uncharacterized protein YyaL (SSP411 family)
MHNFLVASYIILTLGTLLLNQVIQIDPRNTQEMEFWDSNNTNIAQMARSSPPGNQAVAHVCHDFKCSPPVTSPEALRELLNKTLAAASTAA